MAIELAADDDKLVPLVTAIEMKKADHNTVVEVLDWYQAMPAALNDQVPDRFHDRVNEFLSNKTPEDFQKSIGDDWYFSRFDKSKDGKLVIILFHDRAPEEFELEVNPIDD